MIQEFFIPGFPKALMTQNTKLPDDRQCLQIMKFALKTLNYQMTLEIFLPHGPKGFPMTQNTKLPDGH